MPKYKYKPENDVKSHSLHLRVSKFEREWMLKIAKEQGLMVSQLLTSFIDKEIQRYQGLDL